MTAPDFRVRAVPDVVMHDGTIVPGPPPGQVILPDGTVLPGPLAGAQRPRFWTAPPRHRAKDPGCPACRKRGYAGGCGNHAAEELLDQWAPNYGYQLDEWQHWGLTEMCGITPDGRWAAFESALIISRQNGKNNCSINTDILTVSRGWTTFKDIRVGDEVYGSDGSPTRVVGKTEIFPEDVCYEVSFTDGSVHVVGQDHLWPVLDTYNDGKRGWENSRTKDLAKMWGGKRLDTGRMWYRYRVRCDAVVQAPPADLPVDPYLLGYWLGDGASDRAMLFCGKADLPWLEALINGAGASVARIRTHPTTGVQEVSFRTAGSQSSADFRAQLRQLGIFGADRKRIPELYLTASPDQRLALLRGLMDSDGSIAVTNKAPQVEFTTSLPGLADDFWRLARSLGIRVTPKTAQTSLNGVRHKDRTRFLWTPTANPFAMPRKAERWRSPVSRRHEVMSITGIRPVPSVPTRCIQVAADDGVYLVGKTFTPTHNSMLEVRELGGLFLFGEQMIIHTAHEFKAAAEHFRRVRDTISSYDDLSRRVKRVMTSHGDEAIELRPAPTLIFGSGGKRVRRNVGGRLRFLARSRGSGRSFTADVVVYDEAMFLSDEQVGASMPTMSAVPNPQMIYTASAGYHDSVQLAMVRRRMLRHDPSLMGAEWSISPHTDLCPRDEVVGRKTNRYVVCGRHDDRDDPRSWAKANPAFGGRISYEHVEKEFQSMSAAAFDRERLGVGDWPEEEESWTVISEEAWQRCALPDPGGAVRPLAFAVDVDPAMKVSTIAAAWQRPEPGGGYRTVLEIPRGCSHEGTGWVVPRLVELRRAHRPIAVCFPKNGPAAGLADAAENAGLEVVRATSADEAEAFSQIVTGIKNRAVAHLGREQAPTLWGAIASAETRVVGDGGHAWSRRDSESDISPIVAATLASWALNKKRRSYDPRKSIG